MQFTTPWSSDGDDAKAAAESASFPGVDACELPAAITRPVIHRFESIVLLDGEVVPTPGIHDWVFMNRPLSDSGSAVARNARGLLGLTGANYADSVKTAAAAGATSLATLTAYRYYLIWPFRPWQLIAPQWGIHAVVEQAWQARGSSIGELIGGISLAPGEEREVSVFSWQKSSQTLDFSTTELLDRTVETQLTTHDSYQVLARAEKERHWEASMELSYGKGAASGKANASTGGSTRDILERQFKRTREYTRKVSEQIRSERSTRITTVTESGTEERSKIQLKNHNDCHSVTHFFYEILSHYQVRSAPVELSYTIVVPNPLPIINPDWVACHEGLLREELRDESFADGFEAARRLLVDIPSNHLLAVAIDVRAAFRPLPPEAFEEEGGGGGGGLFDFVPGVDLLSKIGQSLVNAAAGLAGLFGAGGGSENEHPIDALGEPPTTPAVEGYLEGLEDKPTLAGLAGALMLLARYYLGHGMPMELAHSFGRAVNLLTAAAGSAAAGQEDDASEEAAGQLIDDELEEIDTDSRERAEATVSFERLRCHIEKNLLHYMQHIWASETPADRYARLSSYSVFGERLWDIAENRLLGFHLNGSVFPLHMGEDNEQRLHDLVLSKNGSIDKVKPLGLKRYIRQAKIYGASLKKEYSSALGNLQDTRKRALTPRRLAQQLTQSLTRLLQRGSSIEAGSTTNLQKQLSDLAESLTSINSAELLTPAETTLFTELTALSDKYTKLSPDTTILNSHLKGIVDAGRGLLELAQESDLYLALPSTAIHTEPVVGKCSACDEQTTRRVEAETATIEASRDLDELEVRRRRERLDNGELDADPPPSRLLVHVESQEDGT